MKLANYKHITHCRACGASELVPVVDLGTQAMTGVFPRPDVEDEYGPLELVRCENPDCELVQLSVDYSLSAMYGLNYGYRTGLNKGMVEHIKGLHAEACHMVGSLGGGDLVVDIGSNDGTLLGFYPDDLRRVGFDPTIVKFGCSYKQGIEKVADFFGPQSAQALVGQKAKIVTSVAMFYDLPDPQAFVNTVADILHDDGVWVFEQSYMPMMCGQLAYDTICHEHLEYYGMKPIARMLGKAGLVVDHVGLNDCNGGSFRVFARRRSFTRRDETPLVAQMLKMESTLNLTFWQNWARAVKGHRDILRATLGLFPDLKIFGLGASTKGNVLLQYAGLTSRDIPMIAEVNPDKFGCVTPGSRIPIVSETYAALQKPDAYLVLPWHFRKGFEARRKPADPSLIFPLPHKPEIVS